MEYNGETIRPQEIKSILEFRRAVEHLATDELIRMASHEDLEHIGELTEAIGKAGNIPDAVEAAFCFQHGLAMAGGNTILPLIYVSFKPVTSKMWQRFCKRYGIRLLYENTKELYEILCTGNAAEARACTDRHLDDIIAGEHKIY